MRILLTIMALLLSGCSMPQIPTLRAYKIDIQQGNYVTQDMVAKLKPGMTRSQVRYALGTPLIVDPFRTDRWDYFYMMYKGGELKEQRVVTVVFRGDVLDRIEGDVVAAAGDAAKPAAAPAETKPVAAPTAVEVMPLADPAAATEKK
jgi:outer membrane protein assembly factor BamE